MTAPLPSVAKLKPNPHWARLQIFGRKGWETVRFGEAVENLNETCDPAEAGLERFIGLEHLEPGSLHVREWGKVADGTTFTRRCRPGQVLFGKRRAYQRKVAVAEFDAVVSGDIYVLAPKGDRLLPELLPFLCLSERFFQHAVGTSAGSLSPRTNWSSLASFEFVLPPLDQQRRIAEILGAVDEVVETSSANLAALSSLKQVAMEEYTLFGSIRDGNAVESVRAGAWQAGRMQSPTRARPHKTPAQRAQLLAADRQTALSSPAFACQPGSAPATLFRWLRQAAAPIASDPGAWIEVPNLLGRQPPAPAYCLRFANGLSVEVGSGFQPDELRALAQLIRGL